MNNAEIYKPVLQRKSHSQIIHCSLGSCIDKTLAVENIQEEKAILASERHVCATKHWILSCQYATVQNYL